MSFGRPGALSDSFKVAPPQRGSFPLDHDGECKTFMISYMRCLKTHGSDSGQCRGQARAYLECRMDNGLMTRDDFKNLGLGDVASTKPDESLGSGVGRGAGSASSNASASASAGSSGAGGQKERIV